jgi:lysyl-tRNA synthetase class 2
MTFDPQWRPSATHAALRRRAELTARAREFFAARAVLEVETPILSSACVTDPQIEALRTRIAGLPGPSYLSTSPEFPMKRLLASGIGDIYQLCKVFRDGEIGRWHNPEFTMLEWYRVGFDDSALMSEVDALVRELLTPGRNLPPSERLTYAESLRRHAGIDPDRSTDADLDRAAEAHRVACESTLDRDAKLDLLMALVVGPKLGTERPTFICDYPASQASLARLKPGFPPVAARFELYLDGIELANGFHELGDAAEQRSRFLHDLERRRARSQHEPPLDENLISALASGLPECAGVALGFDRLIAVALNATRLSEAIAFPITTA